MDTVLDTVGSEPATANLSLLAHTGGMVTVVGRPDLETVAPFGGAPSVHEIAVGAATALAAIAPAGACRSCSPTCSTCSPRERSTRCSRTLPLEEVPRVLVELSARTMSGEAVCLLGSDTPGPDTTDLVETPFVSAAQPGSRVGDRLQQTGVRAGKTGDT